MTALPLPTLVPALALPERTETHRPNRIHRRQPLPLARLIAGRQRATVYGLTAVDARGRLADQVITSALGWRPSQPIQVSVTGDVITVAAAAGGAVAVSRHGRVHLPAAARHACGIAPGDRVLLAAEPADGVLVVHPLAALDAMLGRPREQAQAGGPA